MTSALVISDQTSSNWAQNVKNNIRKQISFAPAFSSLALFLALMIIPKLSMMAFDERLINGINIWIKPIKFDVALATYLATLVVFARFIPHSTRQKLWFKAFNGLVVASIFYEIIWINGAATMGIGSHFNLDTQFTALAYTLAGLFSYLLTSAALVYGILIFRNKKSGLQPSMHFAIWFGSVAMFFLTMITASYMAAQSGHLVGGNALDTEAYPFMGWARDGGDLRVAHFFASHILHALPLLVLLSSALSLRISRLHVAAFAGLYTLFTFYTLWEAMNGMPFLGTLAG